MPKNEKNNIPRDRKGRWLLEGRDKPARLFSLLRVEKSTCACGGDCKCKGSSDEKK